MICKHCSRVMILDAEWKPKPGLDPLLRKFRCSCGRVIYGLTGGVRAAIPEEQLAHFLSPSMLQSSDSAMEQWATDLMGPCVANAYVLRTFQASK